MKYQSKSKKKERNKGDLYTATHEHAVSEFSLFSYMVVESSYNSFVFLKGDFKETV